MKYSKLPQWMRDKIFLEPGGEVVTAFKYDGNPLEYWRNVGIIADAMGSYCHMRSGLGVRGGASWDPESQFSYHYGVVYLYEFVTDCPDLPAELDFCLKRLDLHRVEYTTCATAPRFMFNGANTVSKELLALHPQAPLCLGLYDENFVIDWLCRNRQAQNCNRYDWPYYYVAGCDCDDEDDYYD
jgi:hypothetical protein